MIVGTIEETFARRALGIDCDLDSDIFFPMETVLCLAGSSYPEGAG
jgi:hypothetical protein